MTKAKTLFTKMAAAAAFFLYALMAWEPARSTWYSAEHMATPEVLLDSLLDAYASFMEDQITDNERDFRCAFCQREYSIVRSGSSAQSP